MIQQTTSSRTKEPRLSARTCLITAAALVACLPAAIAQHVNPTQSASPASNDPFAVYEAALNEAASQTLRNVDQPQQTVSGTATSQSPQIRPASIPTPVHKTQASWQRVERLLPVIEPVLRQIGIPLQLAAVVLVESGGDPTALSPKGARGLWQLMPDTARRYGLTVNAETDERLDVMKSTRAAAEYLRDLYAEFHDWQLALAAYNAGEQKVQQAMTRTGGAVFTVAARAMPVETQDYVPAVFNAITRFGDGVSPSFKDAVSLDQAVFATGNR